MTLKFFSTVVFLTFLLLSISAYADALSALQEKMSQLIQKDPEINELIAEGMKKMKITSTADFLKEITNCKKGPDHENIQGDVITQTFQKTYPFARSLQEIVSWENHRPTTEKLKKYYQKNIDQALLEQKTYFDENTMASNTQTKFNEDVGIVETLYFVKKICIILTENVHKNIETTLHELVHYTKHSANTPKSILSYRNLEDYIHKEIRIRGGELDAFLISTRLSKINKVNCQFCSKKFENIFSPIGTLNISDENFIQLLLKNGYQNLFKSNYQNQIKNEITNYDKKIELITQLINIRLQEEEQIMKLQTSRTLATNTLHETVVDSRNRLFKELSQLHQKKQAILKLNLN